MVALHASFKTSGWRWPIRDGDTLEVWRDEKLVGEISLELLRNLVVHYLVGHDLVRRFDDAIIPAVPALSPARPLVKLPPRAVRDRDYRAELRARRRARAG